MKTLNQSFLIFLCSLLLVACSGSDSGSVAPPPAPQGLATIDANAAPVITGGVVEAVFESGSFGDFAGGSVSIVGIATGNNRLSKITVPGQNGWPGYIAGVPIPPFNTLCDVDGSVTVSGNVENPGTISGGDRIELEFFDCDDGIGQILNGIYAVDFNSFAGDFASAMFNLNATTTFTGFEVREGTEITALGGAATLDLDTTLPPVTTVSISGDSVSVSDNTDLATLTAFRTDMTHNAGVFPEAYTSNSFGRVTSTLFEGPVNYSTPVTFAGFAGEYPSTGQLRVAGANGASVVLTALDNINVLLEIDLGDGSGIVTQETTWAELASHTP